MLMMLGSTFASGQRVARKGLDPMMREARRSKSSESLMLGCAFTSDRTKAEKGY